MVRMATTCMSNIVTSWFHLIGLRGLKAKPKLQPLSTLDSSPNIDTRWVYLIWGHVLDANVCRGLIPKARPDKIKCGIEHESLACYIWRKCENFMSSSSSSHRWLIVFFQFDMYTLDLSSSCYVYLGFIIGHNAWYVHSLYMVARGVEVWLTKYLHICEAIKAFCNACTNTNHCLRIFPLLGFAHYLSYIGEFGTTRMHWRSHNYCFKVPKNVGQG